MNTDNLDIEQIRKAWISMGKTLGMHPSPYQTPEDLGNRKTALDRLRDKYRHFWIVALIMTFYSLLMFSCGRIFEGRGGVWLGIAYAAYFLTVFCMDHWLWRGIGSIDPLKMGVAEVAEKALFYRKRHLQFIVVLIPMAVVLLGFTAYAFSSDIYFLIGIAVGAVCGLTVGIIQFRRIMAEYRKLSD